MTKKQQDLETNMEQEASEITNSSTVAQHKHIANTKNTFLEVVRIYQEIVERVHMIGMPKKN